ncbi:MAG TPA: glycosyltransferase [Steroidobacteraceae bacterium]|nr:glycosyltransferase [Steroidobacteraceae bacterium]
MAAVSIVLPCFNRLQYLRDAVESVRAQTFRDWDLILADDGSEAPTLAYLAELARLPQVTILRLPHSGKPSTARNAALRAARGAHVAFLDSDDLWLPEKLEAQVALQRAQPVCRWSYVAMERIHEDGTLMQGEPVRATPAGTIFEPLLCLAADVSMSAVMAERTLLQEVGLFDEALPYFEDFDLFLRLSLASEAGVVTRPLVRMRSHDHHYSANRIGMLEGRAALLRKMQPEAERLGLAAVGRRERQGNLADLARAYAAAHRPGAALRCLWEGRAGAARARWWCAGAAVARSLAPAWARAGYRRLRAAPGGARPE